MAKKGARMIIESVWYDRIVGLLRSGFSVREVIATIQGDDPSFDISQTALYEFKREMDAEEEEKEEVSGGSEFGVNMKGAIRNDAQFCDLVIQRGFEMLRRGGDEGGGLDICTGDIFRAIGIKSKILGATYRGQTLWALLDNQEAMNKVFSILYRIVPGAIMKTVIEEFVREGIMQTSSIGDEDGEYDIEYDSYEDDSIEGSDD